MKAMFCNECGSALDEKGFCQNLQCPNCAANKPNPSKKINKAKAYQEKGKPIVPDCVQRDQDEVPIKQFPPETDASCGTY